VPRKNIKLLGGKPVLVHVIETLKGLGFLTNVHVSTDDPEITGIADSCGAECLGLRAKEISDDDSTFIDLIHKDINRFSTVNDDDREVLFVLPTAALVPEEIYCKGWETYVEKRPEVLMSVETFPGVSPIWALEQKEDGYWRPLLPERVLESSNNPPSIVADAGLFYFFNLDVMKNYKSLMLVDPLMTFTVPDEFTCDVDTMEDWERLERKYRNISENANERHEKHTDRR
jgi:CMP-N-acetylneuraminic acid synthetase